MSLTPHDIARMLDHSTLQPFLTEDDIRRGCELALKYDTASVCARPCDVPILAEMLRGSDVKVCTVIGFPHGAHATQIKVDEARLALDQGCEELDMVINIGEMIRGNEAYVQGEIKQICDPCAQPERDCQGDFGNLLPDGRAEEALLRTFGSGGC